MEKKDPKEEASKIEASGETAQDSNQTVWFLSKEASVLEDLGCSQAVHFGQRMSHVGFTDGPASKKACI